MSIKYQANSKSRKHSFSAIKIELAILNLFQVMTGSSISLQLNTSTIRIARHVRSKQLPALAIITILCLSALFIAMHQYRHYASDAKDLQLDWNDLINLYGVVFASIIIIIESNQRGEHLERFLRIKRFVEHESRQSHGQLLFDQEKIHFDRTFLKIFIAFQLSFSLLETLNMIIFYKHHVWMLYCICQFSLQTVISLRLFHQFWHICSIHFYMRTIHRRIERHIFVLEHAEQMAKAQKCSYIVLDRRSIVDDLTQTQKVFDGIHQMADLINEMSNLSMLSVLMISFLLFCTNLLWIYVQLDLSVACVMGKCNLQTASV